MGKMLELAICDIRSTKGFRKGYDKIIIFFDLDVYRENVGLVRSLIHDYEKKDVVFVYTNPAIELFLLLTLPNSFETLTQEEKEGILKNDWVDCGGERVRFVHKLLIEKSQVNPKHKGYDVSAFSKGFHHAINQENLYLSTKLEDLERKLISNFGDVFSKIEANDFEHFEYDLGKYGL